MAVGIGPTTGQRAARRALIEAVKVALAGEPVDIGRGFRWPIEQPDWVFATATSSDIDPANILPRRSLDERITLELSIGSWRPVIDSPQDAEDEAHDRAFELLERIQEHIRTQDVTLGGAVLWCLPGRSESDGATVPTDTGEGRLIEISADFVCEHRISTV